jgi:uncharacterized DUF497 family protein
MLKFEWDATKAASNLHKHGVSFDEASSFFFDLLAASGTDPDHSLVEVRYITFGLSGLGRLLTVVHSYQSHTTRIISARLATRGGRKLYEKD